MNRIYDYLNNDGYEVANLLHSIEKEQNEQWKAIQQRRHQTWKKKMHRQDKNILKIILLVNGGFFLYCLAKVTYKALTMGL